eukprot:COSAG03_NODE_26011_length_262_cov_0.576687_1_plen_66_part_01
MKWLVATGVNTLRTIVLLYLVHTILHGKCWNQTVMWLARFSLGNRTADAHCTFNHSAHRCVIETSH